jgi:threonine dehydrogenase-like Zn-dependent dehydrogenase
VRHVLIEGPGRVRVDEAPDPSPPGPGGAVVSVDATAICGSDMHFYDGDLDLGMAIPVGHEFLGTVLEVGPDVERFRVGDRVLTASVAGCGVCAGCATGDPVRCVEGPKVFGSGMLPGGQATAVAVPAADFQMLRIPDGMDDEAALLLTDNLSTGWAGAQRAEFAPGGTVVVLGLGAVGLCAVRSALALGAGRVLAVDPVEGRRARAVDSGAEARRSTWCWKRPAAGAPTPSSTQWPRTRHSMPPWPPCVPAERCPSSGYTTSSRIRCRPS